MEIARVVLLSRVQGKAGWGKGLLGDENEYDDYYEDLYDDAAAGDSDAIDEMEDEFGDDWEGEY